MLHSSDNWSITSVTPPVKTGYLEKNWAVLYVHLVFTRHFAQRPNPQIGKIWISLRSERQFDLLVVLLSWHISVWSNTKLVFFACELLFSQQKPGWHLTHILFIKCAQFIVKGMVTTIRLLYIMCCNKVRNKEKNILTGENKCWF